MKAILGLVMVLLLSGCFAFSGLYVSRYCNYDAAVAEGINDARNKFDMAINFAKHCSGDQDALNAAYRKGYLYGLATKSKL